MNERVPLAFLVPLRVFCGIILVLEGWSKVQGDWIHGVPLLRAIEPWMDAGKTYHFFLPVMKAAHDHPKIFGALITSGELVVGGALVVGLMSRLASFLGALMAFSITFASGQGPVPPGNALLMGAIFILFMLAPPGRVLGIDQALRTRLPRWMV
jgi:uncharacterized membrane protein YphA (DoxX/SURF4 family)